ncbi:DUF551 domain-containing protein [Yokenella regensburgei]
MTEFTKERVQWLHDVASEFANTNLKMTLNPEDVLMLTSMLLAAIQQEPVAMRWRFLPDGINGMGEWNYRDQDHIDPLNTHAMSRQKEMLYTALPAPIVPDEITDDLMEQYLKGDAWADSFRGGWNACRAAMLQCAGAAENCRSSENVQVVQEQSNTIHAAQPEQSGVIIGWLCADYQEDVRHEAPLFVLGKNDPSAMWGVTYMPLGNSPVVQDGWISCSERMPEQFIEVLTCTDDGSLCVAALNQVMTWDDGDFFDDIQHVTHWMPLPVTPRQE